MNLDAIGVVLEFGLDPIELTFQLFLISCRSKELESPTSKSSRLKATNSRRSSRTGRSLDSEALVDKGRATNRFISLVLRAR